MTSVTLRAQQYNHPDMTVQWVDIW